MGKPEVVTIASVEGLEDWAAAESERLLAGTGDRWLHVQGVVGRARHVRSVLSHDEQPVLLAAAYLHDIGYSAELRTGVHQLDGARYLRALGHERLARLVAHHSESRCELQARGFGEELSAFEREESAVADALSYCDLLTGPTGRPVSIEERVRGVERRYGDGAVLDSLKAALPALRAAIERTEGRLREAARATG